METTNAELLALQRIDEACVKLQEEGKYLDALEAMERGLVLRQHFFGRSFIVFLFFVMFIFNEERATIVLM